MTDCASSAQPLASRHSQRAAIKCLQLVLQNDDARVKFKKLHGLQQLAAVLNAQHKAVMDAKNATAAEGEDGKAGAAGAGRDLQLIYETLFAAWLMSYNAEIAEKDFTGTSLILNTVRLLREVDKEKIRRVGLALLRNLSGKAENDEAMIHAGFWRVVQQFQAKRWGDEDIVGDVEFLVAQMEAKVRKGWVGAVTRDFQHFCSLSDARHDDVGPLSPRALVRPARVEPTTPVGEVLARERRAPGLVQL